MILSAVFLELLPHRRYEPFLRSFLGVILILMVVRPVLAAGGLSEWIPELTAKWEREWGTQGILPDSEGQWEAKQEEFWTASLMAQAREEIGKMAGEEEMELVECDITESEGRYAAAIRVRDTGSRSSEAREEAGRAIRNAVMETFDLDEVTVEVLG